MIPKLLDQLVPLSSVHLLVIFGIHGFMETFQQLFKKVPPKGHLSFILVLSSSAIIRATQLAMTIGISLFGLPHCIVLNVMAVIGRMNWH